MSEFDADLALKQDPASSEEPVEINESDDDLETDEADAEETPEEDDQPVDDGTGDDPEDADTEVDFPDWAKQYELDEDITSENDLAERYLALKKQAGSQDKPQPSEDMLRVDAILKARGIDGGVEALLSGANPAPLQTKDSQPEQPGSFFTQNQFTNRIKEMVDNGSLKGDHVAGWKQYAEFSDSVMNPLFEKMQMALGSIAQVVETNRNGISDFQWGSVKGRLKGTDVTKAELDTFMRVHDIPDYDSGILMYSAIKNPSLLQKIQKNAEEKGTNKANKKLKRRTSMQSGKGKIPSSSGFNDKKFANADGTLNEAAVDALNDFDEGLKVIAAYEKWAKQKRR